MQLITECIGFDNATADISNWLNSANYLEKKSIATFLQNNNCSPEAIDNSIAVINMFINEPNVAFADTPDLPIIDMSTYLECFDTSQPAIITIYVDQPIADNPATYSGAGVIGHTFVSIEQGGNISSFGFYPNSGNIYPIVNEQANSVMGNDESHTFDVSISIEVDGTTLQDIIDSSVNFNNTYDLNDYNCSDFGIEIANLAGINLTEADGSWPGGGGSNPGTLGQEIRNINNSDTTINDQGGTSPANNKNC
jgi:hypothetical protein